MSQKLLDSPTFQRSLTKYEQDWETYKEFMVTPHGAEEQLFAAPCKSAPVQMRKCCCVSFCVEGGRDEEGPSDFLVRFRDQEKEKVVKKVIKKSKEYSPLCWPSSFILG